MVGTANEPLDDHECSIHQREVFGADPIALETSFSVGRDRLEKIAFDGVFACALVRVDLLLLPLPRQKGTCVLRDP